MKRIKSIICALLAALMIFAVQTACLAQEEGGISASLSPSIISNGFSVDSSDIYAGSSFKLKFSLKNTSSDIDVRNVNIRLSGADAFTVKNDTDTLYADKIAKGSSQSFSKAFYCSASCPAGMYPISVSINYEYFDMGEKQSGSSEFTYNVEVKSASSAIQGLSPQLLISDFSYGGAEIQGGNTFTLDFKIKNNSSNIKVQNVICKLSGGEAFIVADGTDTVAVKDIAASSTQSVTKSFKCLNSAPSGVYSITASISYEYFEGGERVSASSELTMSIPVIQPDKLQFQGIDLADKTVTVDQEADCAFQVVNSGQTRAANATVKLLDEAGVEIASAFIGNIEAGTQFSSNYTLPVTFTKLGNKKLTLVLEYENENAEKKTIEQEFNVTVEEYYDPYAEITESEEAAQDSTNYTPIIIGGIACLAVIVIAAVVIVVIVKKRKARKGSENFDEEI